MNHIDETVFKLTEKWKDWLTFSHAKAENTVKSYSCDLNLFFALLAEIKNETLSVDILETLTLSDFRSWLTVRNLQGCSPATTTRAIGAIRNFYRFLEQFNIHNKAITLLKAPKIAKRLPKTVEYDDIQRLINHLKNDATIKWVGLRDVALLMLLYGSGMRISETLSLKVEDIPLNHKGLLVLPIIGKGDKRRNIFLLPDVVADIKTYLDEIPFTLKESDFIFRGEQNKPLHRDRYNKIIRDARRALNLPDYVTPHAFRHSFASHILNNGANIREVQRLLGHANINNTQIYTKISPQLLTKGYTDCHPRASKNE